MKNFTGIDSAYEAPESPDVHLKTSEMSAEEAAEIIVSKLEEFGVLGTWFPEI